MQEIQVIASKRRFHAAIIGIVSSLTVMGVIGLCIYQCF